MVTTKVQLTPVQEAAVEIIQKACAQHASPERLIVNRNDALAYITIRLDDMKELCCVTFDKDSGKLSCIFSNKKQQGFFYKKINEPEDIESLKQDLLYKLQTIAYENNLPLDSTELRDKVETAENELDIITDTELYYHIGKAFKVIEDTTRKPICAEPDHVMGNQERLTRADHQLEMLAVHGRFEWNGKCYTVTEIQEVI